MGKNHFKKILSLIMTVLFVLSSCMAIMSCTPKKPVVKINSNSSNSDASSNINSNDGVSSITSGATSSATSGVTANSAGNTNSSKNSNTTSTGSGGSVNVKGYTFTLNSAWLPSKVSSTSTLFEKLFFQRKAEVEKQYGCTIKVVTSLAPSMENLMPLIQAGNKVADVIEMMPTQVLPAVSANYIIPWNNVNGINTSDSKWNPSYTNLATFNGKIWGLQFMKPPEARFCVIFNKTLLKSKGIDADGIYNLVNSKGWTFDKLRDYAIKATTQVNNVTTIYGIGGQPDYVAEELLAASNAKLVTLANGKASATFGSQSSKYAMNFFNKLVNSDKVFMTNTGMNSKDTYQSSLPDYTAEFINGKIAFYFAESWVLNQQIKPRVKNFDYGMVPIPLGQGASDYVSPAEHARVFCITSTNKDLVKSVFIFNALAQPLKGYEGDNWWLDDVQNDYFQSNDKDSLKMYQLCLNKSTWDMGLGVQSLSTAFNDNVVFGSIFWNSGKTPSTAIDGMAGTYDSAIKAVFKQ